MSSATRPTFLVAERAVRYLRAHGEPVDSRQLARELLATRTPDEPTARKVLKAAFGTDPRLRYDGARWSLSAFEAQSAAPPHVASEPDRTLLLLSGGMPRGERVFRLTGVSAVRLRGDDVIVACGGSPAAGASGSRLRRAICDALEDAVPVLHDPPGALRALEAWLERRLERPISLRRLARQRLALAAGHDLDELAGRLAVVRRDVDDAMELAGVADACLHALRRDGESLEGMRDACHAPAAPLDWSRFAFDREFLAAAPEAPGTYRFFDAEDHLLYVGRSKNLRRRLASYFREGSAPRSPRVARLVSSLHRIEYDTTGTAIDAVLAEARAIARKRPTQNVQRNVAPRVGRAARLRSILILEPARPPAVLKAYLIRDGRLLGKVGLGERGGGLARVEKLLEHSFFGGAPPGAATPDLDVELIVRWLAAHRDRVVAFDPTDLRSPQEVIRRLRWFLQQRSPFDPDGAPIVCR